MEDYNQLLAKYEDLKQEYEEFRKSSQEYERELELQSDQLEKSTKTLQIARQRSENELETVKTRLNEYQSSTRQQINNLQDELERARAEISEKSERIRRLELTNDDLERTNRALEANCDDLGRQLEAALEQNAFIQSELDERESVCLLIQHLRDELRDVQRENEILQERVASHRIRIPSASVSEQTNSKFNDSVFADADNPSDSPQHVRQSSAPVDVDTIDARKSENDENLPTATLSWKNQRAILESSESEVHRIALSTVGAHAVAAAFQPVVSPPEGSTTHSLASACASAQAQAQSASAAAAGSSLSPSVRIEALALVNQIVRRVTAIESSVRKQLDIAAPQLDGTPKSVGVSLGVNSHPHPHKRICLNLNNFNSPMHSVTGLNNGWLSPSSTSSSRFDFISLYGTLRRRDRANTMSSSIPHGPVVGAPVTPSPLVASQLGDDSGSIAPR